MHKARHIEPASAAAIAILAISMLAVGCASQGDVEGTAERPQPCPRNMTLECFESQTRPTRCSCVSAQELEQTMERVLGK